MSTPGLQWIAHFGTKRPIRADRQVFLRYRGGFETPESVKADSRLWRWEFGDYAFEITHYAYPRA